jgi:NAD(P)-binding Rossmann-like domain
MPDEIVDTARLDGYNGRVFCIGSFAKRVNFLAQQNRALNTVWALHKLKKFRSGDNIAVIGAGMAGITAAAAFMGYGATVHVYEKGGRALHRQRQTGHRRVHPSINAWPAGKHVITTELPFFDWYSAPCKEISEDIAASFESLFENTRHRLFRNCTAQAIKEIGTELLEIDCDPPIRFDPARQNSLTYRLVLIAIGYGEERRQEKFPYQSYWREDNLEALRDSGEIKAFIVSGCGDGGLIDALRLVHLDFRAGQLAFEVASSLAGSSIAKTILKAEEDSQHGSDTRDVVYPQMARQLGAGTRHAALHSKLVGSMNQFPGTVYLGDWHYRSPNVAGASPIHKLLVAHVREHSSKIQFRSGEVTEEESKEIRFHGLTFPPLPNTHVVIRHGAEPNFLNLLTPEQIQKLEAKQRGRSDFHDRPRWRPLRPYPVPDPFPKHDPSSQAFIKSRKPLALRAMRQFCEDVTVGVGCGRLVVAFPDGMLREKPSRLFGIRVSYHPERTYEAL